MRIGRDVRADKDTVIKRTENLVIGNHVAIDKGFYCTTRLMIGDYVHISPYVTIIGGEWGQCWIGNFVTISAGARLICVSDSFDGSGLVGPIVPYKFRNQLAPGNSITVGDLAGICTNAVISPGVVIGEGAVVGANSFVNKNIPAWEVWAGSPARFIKKRDDFRIKFYANQLRQGDTYDEFLV